MCKICANITPWDTLRFIKHYMCISEQSISAFEQSFLNSTNYFSCLDLTNLRNAHKVLLTI